jgi:hypothetical protein
MTAEEMQQVPTGIWDLFNDVRVPSLVAYKAAEMWHSHLNEIREAFADVSHGPREEKIWALVNERWVTVWSAFVAKLAAGSVAADLFNVGTIEMPEPAPLPLESPKRKKLFENRRIAVVHGDELAAIEVPPSGSFDLLFKLVVGLGLAFVVWTIFQPKKKRQKKKLSGRKLNRSA